MLGVAGGDVEADQPVTLEAFDDDRVIQYLAFDDLAADAPVGVPVEQQRCAGRPGLSEHAVQIGGSADGLPGAGVLRRSVVVSDTGLADRVERVGLAAEGAIPAGQCVKHQEHAEQLPQAFAWWFIDELQRTHEQADTAGQQTDQQQGDLPRQDTAEQADGQPEQQHTNGVFHVDQPRTALRQPGCATGGHQQQRRAHAEAEHEQFQAAAQRIATGADVQQRPGQWCRNAG
ncbi:hypothetical protein D3C79_808440 [compost metagenome]